MALWRVSRIPPELAVEEAAHSDIEVAADWQTQFESRMAEQRERSRSASAGTFKGGLADQSAETTKLSWSRSGTRSHQRQINGDVLAGIRQLRDR